VGSLDGVLGEVGPELGMEKRIVSTLEHYKCLGESPEMLWYQKFISYLKGMTMVQVTD